jgi:hypothetical protein
MAAGNEPEPGTFERASGPLSDSESLKVSHTARADHGSERLREPSPNVPDHSHCANRCLDMWNDSVDHATRSRLLRMGDAWLLRIRKIGDERSRRRIQDLPDWASDSIARGGGKPLTPSTETDLPKCQDCNAPMQLRRVLPTALPKDCGLETRVFVCASCGKTDTRTIRGPQT